MTQCYPRDFLWKGGKDHLLLNLPNHLAMERWAVKILYKPMIKFHDNPSVLMEGQICGKVEHPRCRAGDSPANDNCTVSDIHFTTKLKKKFVSLKPDTIKRAV